MAEYDENATRATARRFDLLSLLAGIATLLVAVYAGTGGADWMGGLPDFDPRWVLAGGAVLVGTLMLIASMRGGKKH